MHVKIDAIRHIRWKLENERSNLICDKAGNKREINSLARKQALIKKQIAQLDELLRGLPKVKDE